ncbi:glycosyltransferase, partial [Patescibacteria group bacterium]|nr:glycosyltransferase [Patescibacteria group bacterium]
KGGAERYLFELRDLLIRHGHVVVPFAMKDGRNESTYWSDRFVSPVQTDRVRLSWQGLRTAGRMLYSFEARRKFSGLLDEVKPEIVHIHNIYHQISPSILPEAKNHGIPVVLTAHDYKLIAPNYSLFHNGAICEHTKSNQYWSAVRARCVKGSFLASALAAAEMTLHRRLGLWHDNIDRIIAPSSFLATLLEEKGIAKTKIVHIPHFIDATLWHPHYDGDYALFVGRLSSEKGVETLVRAAALIKNIPVHIVGIGPEDIRLHRIAEELGADNIQFKGYLSGEALRHEYRHARFVVVPSVCYEVFGLSVLEAYASGKPVVASRLGGLSEVVREGETGFLVSVSDPEDLAERMEVLWNSPDKVQSMGQQARHLAETDYAPEVHYRRIMAVYNDLLARK